MAKNNNNNKTSDAAAKKQPCAIGRPASGGKDKCEKYGIAVMNLVMGEDIGMPQEELFAHLKVCKECRSDLFEWRDTYTVMRMEADAKKPEYKQKAAEMAARIKKDLLCDVTKAGQTADRNMEIGKPAGDLWKIIAREKIIRVADIPQKLIKYDIDQAYAAYGWLGKEKKVEIVYHEIGKCVKLTKDEEAKIPFANL